MFGIGNRNWRKITDMSFIGQIIYLCANVFKSLEHISVAFTETLARMYLAGVKFKHLGSRCYWIKKQIELFQIHFSVCSTPDGRLSKVCYWDSQCSHKRWISFIKSADIWVLSLFIIDFGSIYNLQKDLASLMSGICSNWSVVNVRVCDLWMSTKE